MLQFPQIAYGMKFLNGVILQDTVWSSVMPEMEELPHYKSVKMCIIVIMIKIMIIVINNYIVTAILLFYSNSNSNNDNSMQNFRAARHEKTYRYIFYI